MKSCKALGVWINTTQQTKGEEQREKREPLPFKLKIHSNQKHKPNNERVVRKTIQDACMSVCFTAWLFP